MNTRQKNLLTVLLMSALFLVFSAEATACTPWQRRMVWNSTIVGDEENAKEDCSGTLEVGDNAQYFCNYGMGNRWSVAIPGDRENAELECAGVVVEVDAYFRCVEP